jgi:hypothetical protein
MITSVISSAARLSLAPARLAGRMAGSLLRELRGNGAGDAGTASSSARAKPAARTGANGRRERDAAVARAKAKPKRGAGGTRTKAQPKRPTTRARAGARPKPEPKPLDDVTIARKVETTIFRDIDVDKGKVDVNVAERVVWLRGEVASQDLIKELEARATGVTEVRRVENLLHVPEAPAPGRTDSATVQAEAEGSSSPGPDTPAVVAAESSEEASPPVPEIGAEKAEVGDNGHEPAPTGDAARPAESAVASSGVEEPAGPGRPEDAASDEDPEDDGSTVRESPEVAEVDQHARGDEPAEHGPGAVGLGEDSAYQSSGTGQRGPD